MERTLILGATGMLGHALCRRLAADGGGDVWATSRTEWRRDPRLAKVIPEERCIGGCDLQTPNNVERALHELRPRSVVNCVGLIKQRPEAADTELAIELNALLPHRLVRFCDDAGAKLIQLGTDCVFSGRRGNYSEADIPDPVDLYGRSKLLGEVSRPPHLTLRTSMIGWQLQGHEGLAEWFWTRRGRAAQGWSNAIFSGLTTYALADVIATLLAHHPALSGLYHVAAKPISKYDLLAQLDAATGAAVHLEKVEGPGIDRSLNGERFLAATEIQIPRWDAMIADLATRRADYD